MNCNSCNQERAALWPVDDIGTFCIYCYSDVAKELGLATPPPFKELEYNAVRLYNPFTNEWETLYRGVK
jgi:hypothetical protein